MEPLSDERLVGCFLCRMRDWEVVVVGCFRVDVVVAFFCSFSSSEEEHKSNTATLFLLLLLELLPTAGLGGEFPLWVLTNE